MERTDNQNMLRDSCVYCDFKAVCEGKSYDGGFCNDAQIKGNPARIGESLVCIGNSWFPIDDFKRLDRWIGQLSLDK